MIIATSEFSGSGLAVVAIDINFPGKLMLQWMNSAAVACGGGRLGFIMSL